MLGDRDTLDRSRACRPFTRDDLESVAALLDEAFRASPHEETWLRAGRVLVERGQVVASALAEPIGQFYGGRPVPAVALAGVAVSAVRRGRGCGDSLLKALMAELAEGQSALVLAFPSETAFYRRFGFEYCGCRISYSCRPGDFEHPGAQLEVPSVRPYAPHDLSALETCYRAAAAVESGMLQRPRTWWADHILADEQGTLRGYLVDDDNGIDGYLLYDQHELPGPAPFFEARCRELIWRTAPALQALLRVISGQGWHARRVSWPGPADEPLQAMAGQLSLRVDWRLLWIGRIVSLAGAIRARGFPSDLAAELDITVSDPLIDANDGRFRLSIANGRGCIEPSTRTRGTPCAVDVGTLAAIYTGWLHPRRAARLGRLRADRKELDVLAGAFAGPSPWIAEYF